jgi:uncharacterized protein YcaQ
MAKPKPSHETVSLAEARRMAVRAAGLGEEPAPFGPGKPGVLKTIQHLGYVQVDTISVVQRAHHHVLWSRVPDYTPEMLHQLQEPERTVFEYWNHAASYLPMDDFRFSIPLMRQCRKEMHWPAHLPDVQPAMRRVLRQIRIAGSMLLRDFEGKTKVQGWATVSKIERRALHELWMRGQVMIQSRQGFQKVYNLTERVLPSGVDRTPPTKRETAEFHIRRSLRALGIARLSELHYLQETARASVIRSTLQSLVRSGEVLELRVADFPGTPCYCLPGALELSRSLKASRLHILSPFDNLVIQRERLRWLFNFHYIIECYVPAAKRVHGYYVLPLLWGDRFIGRMDAKADRAARNLIVHHLMFEPGFKEAGALASAWNAALPPFMAFQGCDTCEITKVTPRKVDVSAFIP